MAMIAPPLSPIVPVLDGLADNELRASRALVHRAIAGRHRLGWAPEGPPVVLSALCLAIGDELDRRGSAVPFPCPACRADLEL